MEVSSRLRRIFAEDADDVYAARESKSVVTVAAGMLHLDCQPGDWIEFVTGEEIIGIFEVCDTKGERAILRRA